MNITGGALEFEASIDGNNFQRQVNQIKGQLKDLTDSANKQASSVESFAKKAATLAAGFFSLQAATGFINSMVEVRGEFQKIEVAFKTMLHSKDAADKLMAQAVQLAAITPFTLQEVAAGAKQLLAYGFAAEDVTKNLESLGNIASGVGSSLTDVVYLYGTLKASGRVTQMDINQFAGRGIPIYQALADTMKINVEQVRAYVSAGKIGFPEVEKAFTSLTSAGGQFFNLMQEQSKTLTGQISNLKDAWARMLNDLGEQNEGIFADAIGGAIDLVGNYKKIIDIIEGLIIVYGAYRAAVVLNTVTLGGWSFAEGVHIQLLIAKEAVMKSITGAAVAAAAATAAYTAVIAALGAVVYSFVQYQDAAEIAQNAVNKAQDEGARAADSERGKLQGLIGVIQSHTSTKDEQKAAYDALQKETGNYLKSYSLEEVAAGKAAGAIALFTGKVALATATEKEYAAYKGLTDKLQELNQKGIDAVTTWDRLKLSISNTFGPLLQAFTGNATGLTSSYFKSLFSGSASDEEIVNQIKKRTEDAKKALLKANPAIQKALDDAARKLANEKKTGLIGDKYSTFNELFGKGVFPNIDQLIKLAPDKAALEKLQKALTESYEAMAPGEPQKKIIKAKVEELTKFINDEYGSSVKAQVKANNDRRAFLDNLNKQEAENFRKSLTTDESALKEIRDKYAQQRKEAKKLGLGNGVIQRINKQEISETGTLQYDLETKALKEKLENQKSIQIEYENYISKFGVEAAKKKYGELKILNNEYFNQLQQEQKKLTDIPVKERTGGQAERLKQITGDLKAETQRIKENTENQLADALQASETYNTKRLKILDDYLAQKKIIESAANVNDREARVAELERQKNENLDLLGKENIERMDSYQNLYNNIDRLSVEQAKKEIQRVRVAASAALALGNISVKAFLEIMTSMDDAEHNVNNRLPDGLRKVAGGFNDIANAVSSFDAELGKALGTLGNMLNSVASIKDNFDFIKKNGKTDIFGSISAGLGILGAGISIISTIGGLFSNSKRDAEQRDYANKLQLKATEALNKALDRQLALIKDIYGPERIAAFKKGIDDINKAQIETQAKLQGKLTLTGDKTFDDVITKVNNGEKYNELAFKAFIEGYKASGKSIDLTKQSLEQLNKLMDEGKLDERTAAIVQSMIDLEQQARDTKNALTEELTGINFDSLNDEIRSIFDNGEASAEKFAEVLEKSIRSAFSNAFKRNEIEKAMQPFYDQLYKAGEDGVFTEQEIADLRAQKDAIAKLLADKAAAYEKIIGDDPLTDNAQTAAGKIQAAITEDTAGEVLGSLHGIQLSNNNIHQQQMKDSVATGVYNQQDLMYSLQKINLLTSINANTKRTGDNTDGVRDILKNIERNTGDTTSAILRAKGI